MYGDHVADNSAMAELNLLFVLLSHHSDKRNDDDEYMIRKHAHNKTRRFVISYEYRNLHDPAPLTAT